MLDFFLKLFGVKAHNAGRITEAGLSFHGVNPMWVFLAAIVLGLLVAWMYKRTGGSLSLWRKLLLASFRAVFILFILGLLLRPVLAISFEQSVRRTLLFLFDTSSSMSEIKDQRTETDDLKRAAIARNLLDPSKGLKQAAPSTLPEGLSTASRIDIAKSAFKNEKLDLLTRLAKEYDLAAYTFDDKTVEIPGASYRLKHATDKEDALPDDSAIAPILKRAWIEKLEAKGNKSAVGEAVRNVISLKRGQLLAGIVLVTDGASNSGVQPLDAANLSARDRVPLYVYGVGITSPRDIIVASILSPEVVFAKDEAPVSVRVRGLGMAGQTANLTLQLADQKVEQQVTFNADGEQVITLKLNPQKPGEYDIFASIPAREDEVVKDNNSSSQRIRVIDGKIKVLWLEQFPRWEFKYAQAALMRDRRVDLKCVLLEGDPSITRGADSPYLSEFPTKKEDLFKYDLVILGDVDPARALSPQQMDNIAEFVSKFGGSVVMVAGKRFGPAAWRKTVVEKMLPVELESVDIDAGNIANRPIAVELTPAGKASTMLRLADKELESATKWAALPPLYWVARVARAKPAAEVLVVDPDPAKSSRFGKMPVIASHQYGLGQVLYIGTENLWRWRKNTGDMLHSTLWGQMTQRMALPHLLGASKRTQLASDQKKYIVGQKATLYARLYTEAFEPITEPSVKASITRLSAESERSDVLLRPIPGQPGMYRGEYTAFKGGNFAFAVDHDTTAKLEFSVDDPKLELADSAMNKALLEQMATSTGGAFFREEDLIGLPEKISAKQERIASKLEVEIWSTPIYLILMLTFVTAEWIGRKMCQLK